MSSQIRNANPVKVNPSMIAKANDFNANPVKVNPSMIAKANDFTVPAKSPERQKSSLDRTCASILKMTKAEYEVFKEKYTDENGNFDSSALERAARNINKIMGSEFHSLSADEAVLKLAQRVKSRQDGRSGYCHLFHFLMILLVYLLMLYMQGSSVAYKQYFSLQDAINDGKPIETDFYKWLGDKILTPVFVDPPCGDGICENKGNDHSQVGRFGCANDCGEFPFSTSILFNITRESSNRDAKTGGYNICPKGATSTSGCVFKEYMKKTENSLTITKNMWGNRASYTFYEHNFSSPFLDGEYVIRLENTAGEGGIGVLATHNYTRYVLGYQLSYTKQTLCKDILDQNSNATTDDSPNSIQASARGLSRPWQVPSDMENYLPCLGTNVSNNTECRTFCVNNVDSCLEFPTMKGIVLQYPTLQKACTEYNILTGRKIGSPCTSIQTLSEEFRKIDLERVLQKIEIEIELATSNGKVIIAEDMSNENGFFHKFSVGALENQLRLLGCQNNILPLKNTDIRLFLYPEMYNISTTATKTVLNKPRCLDVSQICKRKNGIYDFENNRCICAPNKFGVNCDQDCPVNENNEVCNGNGICSSMKKMCKCNEGYDPADNCLSKFICDNDANCGGVEVTEGMFFSLLYNSSTF